MVTLDDVQLEALIFGPETELLERKPSLKAHVDDICKDICAFANDLPGHGRPGVIVLGLKDDLSPAGLVVYDGLIQNMAALRTDKRIHPLPTMSVLQRTLRGVELALIVVQPSKEPPIRFEGKVWVRVGSRRDLASRDDERLLTERRQSWDLCFDQRPVRGAGLEDLDLERIRLTYLPRAIAPEILAENHRPIEHQLGALHLLSPEGCPTVAALLLFGVEPGHWFPGAFVQFVRFEGATADSPVLDSKRIEGPLPDQARRLDDLIEANVRVSIEIGTLHEERRQADYSKAALQQLLRNALMHRSYEGTSAPTRFYWFSDRIEISSPGGLFGVVNERNFGQPNVTDYRNPKVATALKELGVVQQFGLGILLARRSSEKEGCPPPEFAFSREAVSVTLRSGHLRDQVLVLDTRGGLKPDSKAGQDRVIYLLPPSQPGLDADLRRRDAEAWDRACAAIDRGLSAMERGHGADLHLFCSAPYALAVWLGTCVDRYARGRRVQVHLWVPGAGTWLPLPVPGESQRELTPYWRRLEDGQALPDGEGVLLAIEGSTPLDPQRLAALAARVGARHIRALRALDPSFIQDQGTANGATVQLRSALMDIKRALNPDIVHVVMTAPVALAVELGRLLNPRLLRKLVVYDFDPTTGEHVPVLDIARMARIS